MSKNFIITLLITLFACINTFANDGIEKQTHIYSIKGVDTLRLDKYDLPDVKEPKPCVIFMFGGGFVSGTRDKESYRKYFDHLVYRGYSVISIDYRLGFRNVDANKLANPMQFVEVLGNSISIAVEDLFDATAFILNRAKEWSIDCDQIISSGSSAGAISVLHGEYAICNKAEVTKKLPKNFNYAGVIAFAGAILNSNGDLIWQSLPSPIQMFHGDADSNVPYDKLEFSNLGFYGSKYIATQLDKLNSPYYFHKVENAAHEISNLPMTHNLKEIDSFLDKFVVGKQPLIINTEEKQIGKEEMKKDFELIDYIKSNF